MATVTITKTGRIELDEPICADKISLNSITMYFMVYNISEPSTFVDIDKKVTTIKPGYYTYEQLNRLTSGAFEFDDNTLKLKDYGAVTGGLKKLIKDSYPQLTPLCFYMYVDGIDTSKNYVDGKRSSLLSMIPIGNRDITQVFKYQPFYNAKKMYSGMINSLNVAILDENKNHYEGKFAAELIIK